MMKQDVDDQKDVFFYGALVNAWVTTKFEKDKHLFVMSSAALGLLMTFHTNLGSNANFWLWIASVSCFFSSVALTIMIFNKNAGYLEAVLREKNSKKRLEHELENETRWASRFFMVGTVFLVILAIGKTGFVTVG